MSNSPIGKHDRCFVQVDFDMLLLIEEYLLSIISLQRLQETLIHVFLAPSLPPPLIKGRTAGYVREKLIKSA